MKNRLLLFIFTVLLSANYIIAQVCGTYEGSLEAQIQKYPAFYESLEGINQDLEIANKLAISNMKQLKSSEGKKIIPVVVHVIHNGGGENLSVSQIQNGLNHLNANINGQADNFLSITPDIFAAVRGDLNVEFRLAKKDPMGNPTSGIVRVQSELTDATVTSTLSRDRVKALSYWSSYQYFNIWVVRSMPAGPDPTEDPALNGYAQFPFSGRMSTDGVMIRSAVFAVGETITHEVGHWLGLCHTWACGAETCGTDNISDTPQDSVGTFDFNGVFPFNVNACTSPNGAAGEMYMNYMDYQADAVQSMFTKGQNVVMNETLDGIYDTETNETGIGYREYMWSAENLAATGVLDGYLTPTCSQKADFSITLGALTMCKDRDIIIRGNKSTFGNGNVTSMLWDFGDGQTDNTNNNQLLHTYSSEGLFDVSLTVEYNEITEARADNFSDLPSNASSYDSITKTIIVQGTLSDLVSMGADNINLHLDLDGYSSNSYTDTNGVFYADTLFYRGELEQTTYVAYFENTCSTTTVKTNFISINPNSSNTVGNFTYSFENESDLSTDWSVDMEAPLDSDWAFDIPQNSTWEWINGVAANGSGNSSIMIAKDNFSSSNVLTSKAYNLSSFANPAISFSYSGAATNNFPVNELNIYYSDDCGEIWRPLGGYGKGSLTRFEVSNAGLYDGDFIPKASEWNNVVMSDTISSNSVLKSDNIRFMIEYVHNGSSNNFYIDNIQIGESSGFTNSNLSSSRLSIYPNPSTGKSVVRIENLANTNVEVRLVDVLGKEITSLFDDISSDYYESAPIDLSNLENGIYFIKIVTNGNVISTEKIILSK